jgi:uncharacterized Fe-S cluster-containing protein
MFVAAVQLSELRARQTILFEQERNILFVDSLLKRGIDENGLAMVNADQKRVLENRLDNVSDTISELEEILIANNVMKVNLDGVQLFEFKHEKCSRTLAVRRGVTSNGKFAILEVRFCYE